MNMETGVAIIVCVSFITSCILLVVALNHSNNKQLEVENEFVEQSHDLQESRAESTGLHMILNATRERTEDRVLWLTRVLVSETNKPDEMWYIANVVRNRVDQQYRGKNEYRDVILDSRQFSAFNTGRSTRDLYINMTEDNTPWPRLWQEANRIARQTIMSDRSELPLPVYVTHFYSEVSMPDHNPPYWARSMNQVHTPIQSERFRFYTR